MVTFLLVFSIVFLSIGGSVLSNITDLGVFPYIIIGFILIVFGLVMATAIRKMIKDLTTRYAVAVGHEQLEYYEFAKTSGVTKNSRSIPLNEVKNITYSFSPLRMNNNDGLAILTTKDPIQIQHDKEKPLSALKDLFKGKDKAIQLSIAALNPVECLQLETWLQELIQSKGNNAIT